MGGLVGDIPPMQPFLVAIEELFLPVSRQTR